MSCCCTDKEQKVGQSPKLARHQQVQRDKEFKELQRKLADSENEKHEAYRQIQLLQDKENKFKKALEIDVLENCRIIKQYPDRIEAIKKFSELNNVKDIQPIDFLSIREYFGVHSSRSSIHENSEIIIQKLIEVYNLFPKNEIFSKKLLFCVYCYINILQEIIKTGYNESIGDIQLKDTRNFIKENFIDLYQKLQSLLSLAKAKFTKQRSRILEEAKVDTSHQEMKLRSKIEDLQTNIQRLLDQRQNFNQMQKYFITKSEIIDRFQQLEKMISGATQVNKYEKEKSLLSEETEPELKQIHDVLLMKEKEIQQLSQRLSQKDKMIRKLEQKLKQSLIIDKPEIPNIRRSRSSAQNELDEIIKQNMKFGQSILLREGQIELLKKKVEELEEANRKDVKELQYVRSQLIQKEQAASSLTQRLQQAQNRINTKIMQTEKLQHSMNEELIYLNNQISSLKFKLDEYSQRQSLQNEEKRMQINRQSERQYDQIQRLTLEKAKILKEKQLLITNNTNKANEVEELKKSIQTLNNDIENQRKHFQSLLSEEQFKLSEAEMKVNKIELEIIETKEELQKLQKRYKEDNSSEKLRVQLELVKKVMDKTKIKLQQAQEENRRLISQLDEQKDLSMSLQSRLDKMQETTNIDMTNRRMRTASFVEHRTLFIGDVLQRRKGEKKYLMDNIESLMMREIEKTKLVYEFKRDQKTNFHNYIDNHSNLVLILETHKALIACYYSGVLQEDAPMIEEALILSLDSRRTYFLNTLQHNPSKDPKDTRIIRGMIYDKYFLIFGNAEVRIRTGEARVFSNFGIMSSYFDARKEKVNSLLHEGSNNQVDIVNYQIHEVIFSEEFTLERTS